MPISIEADPTLAQGYIKVNGTTAATISTAGIVSGGIPAGAVMPFAMNSAPSGWLAANGNVVPNGTGTVQGITADFSALYAAVGTSFGAAGTLPDLRGIFVRGSGSQTISGETYSGTFAAKQKDELKAHTHTVTGSSGTGLTGGGGSAGLAQSNTTSSTGGTETRPANIALLYCIKH